MSSKGRKDQPENIAEFFETPAWCIESLISSDIISLPGGTWIEPCSGKGSINKTINKMRDDVDWVLAEIQEEFQPDLAKTVRIGRDKLLPACDYLSIDWQEPIAEVAIFNPPFSITMEFIETSFKRAKWVACLQRLNFFGSLTRAPWLRKYCPDIFSFPKRASFRPDGKTDSIEYGWMIFPPQRERREGRIAMLELTESAISRRKRSQVGL